MPCLLMLACCLPVNALPRPAQVLQRQHNHLPQCVVSDTPGLPVSPFQVDAAPCMATSTAPACLSETARKCVLLQQVQM